MQRLANTLRRLRGKSDLPPGNRQAVEAVIANGNRDEMQSRTSKTGYCFIEIDSKLSRKVVGDLIFYLTMHRIDHVEKKRNLPFRSGSKDVVRFPLSQKDRFDALRKRLQATVPPPGQHGDYRAGDGPT